MSSKSRRLLAVARLAAWREQQQLAQASQARVLLDRQQAALDQLQDYREDYLSAAPQGRRSAAELANAMRFLQDIESAARIQGERVAAAQQQWDQQRSEWEQLHAKRRRLDDCVIEADTSEQRQRDKHRQRAAEDSWAAQNAGRRFGAER